MMQKSSTDIDECKKSKTISAILTIKVMMTLPFYLIAIIEPSYLPQLSWLLYLESNSSRFHVRNFYLLATYRACLQVYYASLSNGYYQKKFISMEAMFDFSLLLCYIHEKYVIQTSQPHALFDTFSLFHLINCGLSLVSLRKAQTIKVHHIV